MTIIYNLLLKLCCGHLGFVNHGLAFDASSIVVIFTYLKSHGLSTALSWVFSYSGLNVGEALQALNAPEWILKPFSAAGGTVGVFATAYVLYKVAVPLRYGLTLWLTPVIVHRLRTAGRLPPLAEQDRLRNLAREGATETREKIVRTGRRLRTKGRNSRNTPRSNSPTVKQK